MDAPTLPPRPERCGRVFGYQEHSETTERFMLECEGRIATHWRGTEIRSSDTGRVPRGFRSEKSSGITTPVAMRGSTSCGNVMPADVTVVMVLRRGVDTTEWPSAHRPIRSSAMDGGDSLARRGETRCRETGR